MVYDPLAASQPSSGSASTGGTAAPYDPLVGSPWSSTYPDMTPQPPPPTPPKLTDTSWFQLPSAGATNSGGTLWDTVKRVGSEAADAYRSSEVITPEARAAVANTGWLGRNIGVLPIDLINTAGADLSALGAGATAAVSEIAGGGNPALTRDVHALTQVLPVAAAGVPAAATFPVTREAPGPPPLPSTSINVPADAAPVVKGLYKAADATGKVLDPSVTQGFMTDLDNYAPQTRSGQATAGPNAATDLITRLRNLTTAPLDTIKSVQDVDQQIQDAISGQYSATGITPEGRTMIKILQDFRARTQGDTGFPELNTANQGYAAQMRMQDVQRMLDDTELSPNQGQAIGSRVQQFLRDPRNTRGWTDDEINSLATAARGGAVREWVQDQGAKLATMAGAVMGGGWGALGGGTVGFGLNYALRNALTNLRIGQLNKTMQLMGQRVPQPGTVPMQSPPPPPPGLLGTALRYQPLTTLLAPQSQNGQ